MTREPRTRGGQLTLEALQARGWSVSRLARELGVSPNAAWRWTSGRRRVGPEPARPSLETAVRLRDLLGVPVESWAEPPR